MQTLLMRKDILSEEEARFYTAQTVLAIDSIHGHNYIHRWVQSSSSFLVESSADKRLANFQEQHCWPLTAYTGTTTSTGVLCMRHA
jgi:hypothetical protein